MQSIGGEWADGMAIYDSIILCKSYVTIISYGQAESMSSIILQAADNRLLTPNSYFMAHYGSTSLSCDYLNAINWMDFEKRLSNKMLEIYAKRCLDGEFFEGKDENQVKKYLSTKLKSGDWFLEPAEAVYYGFADGVVS
jgi:ATP-dependent protease ClpP protease subunit